MKEIIMRVTDDKAATILSLIIGEADELTVTRIGPDPETVPVEKVKRMHRGDKKATDIVMEMFSEDIPQRSKKNVQAYLVDLGFADGTYTSALSQLVKAGLLRYVNRDMVEITEQGLAGQ